MQGVLAGSRMLGFFLLLLACATLLAIHLVSFFHSLPYGGGGVLGYFLGMGLNAFFSKIGATLILIAFLLAGITLFSAMSWFGLFELAGRGLLKVAAGIVHGIALLWQRYRASRAARTARTVTIPPRAKAPREPRWTEEEVALTPTSIKSAFRKVVTREVPVEQPIIAPQASRQLAPIKSFAKSLGLPSLDLLDLPKKGNERLVSKETLTKMSHEVETRLADFGITASVVAVHPGPVITRFEIDLAPGIKSFYEEVYRNIEYVSNECKNLAKQLKELE
jgi:S-DNA-T family DNA segregation ATPase FtsK/SpoIIIE